MKLSKSGNWKRTLVTLIAVLLLNASCTWVRLEKGAGTVAVRDVADVVSCKKIGQTTVKVVGKVVGINRSREKMGRELEILAKNAALNMEGNSVVPSSKIETGRQSFDIFNCEN